MRGKRAQTATSSSMGGRRPPRPMTGTNGSKNGQPMENNFLGIGGGVDNGVSPFKPLNEEQVFISREAEK